MTDPRIRSCGFTLVELVAVTAVLGLVLVVTVPRFDALSLFSRDSDPVSRLILQLESLRSRAVRDGADILLHVQSGGSKIWTTAPSMTDEEKEAARDQAEFLDDSLQVLDVAFPGRDMEPGEDGAYAILFSRKGYCDKALIHLRRNVSDITLKLEPFRPSVERASGYLSYEPCH